MPIIHNGDILESFKTLYPEVNCENKNVEINGKVMTRPLATSQLAKSEMKKDGSSLLEIYNDVARGDILRVDEINGTKIKVTNLSLKEEYRIPFEIDKYDLLKQEYNIIQRIRPELKETLKKLNVE